jgi:hypothetical protein
MTAIIAFLLIGFATAGCIGLVFHRSSFWHLVDLIYYPLSAIGVALLFANNATQRQLYELGQLSEKHKAELHTIVSAKPSTQTLVSGGVADSSFRLISTISELGDVCKKVPTVDPQCMVAENLEPSVTAFMQITLRPYTSPELKLASECLAAEHLLDDIRAKDQISSLIGDELIAQYKHAVAKNYDPLAYEAVVKESQAFEQRGLGQIEWLRNVLQDKDSESMRLVLAMRRSEVDFGKTILQGLFPCIVAPKKDLDLLAKWTTSRQTEEEEIKRIERDRQRIKESSAGDPLLLWAQLNLWPFVIVSALFLKFAKASSALRKSVPTAVEPRMPEPEKHEALSLQAPPEGAKSEAVVVQSESNQPIVDDINPKF